MEIASNMPRIAMASAALNNGGTTAQSDRSKGMPMKDGIAAASAPSSPMVRMPSTPSPRCCVSNDRKISVINSAGSFGNNRSNTQKISSVTTPMNKGYGEYSK